MANYLNSIKPFSLFRSERMKPYFVDKSLMLAELQPMVEVGGSYICITRPRRFGKTLMASMIAAYFEKKRQSNALFQDLKIAGTEQYEKHLNAYNVIYITFNEVPKNCKTYEQYIGRIENRLIEDLKEEYPEYGINEEDAVWDILNDIYEQTENGFVFVLDEWDYIFHRDFVSEKEKLSYIEFLSNLLKGQPYVSLAYMTGILPIAKYSSGSELNMFLEYTMAAEEKYSEYFGFTEMEVDEIYSRFLKNQEEPKVTRETLKIWYDGYHTKGGESIYNPRSVVASLTNNNLGNYWTNSGPYDEIFYPVIDKTQDCIILELKVDSTPEEAIDQIKKKRYALAFAPKMGEEPVYTGRILAVGIVYNRESKMHECMIEVLREGMPEKDI